MGRRDSSQALLHHGNYTPLGRFRERRIDNRNKLGQVGGTEKNAAKDWRIHGSWTRKCNAQQAYDKVGTDPIVGGATRKYEHQ